MFKSIILAVLFFGYTVTVETTDFTPVHYWDGEKLWPCYPVDAELTVCESGPKSTIFYLKV
jgi:hypothetical protein